MQIKEMRYTSRNTRCSLRSKVLDRIFTSLRLIDQALHSPCSQYDTTSLCVLIIDDIPNGISDPSVVLPLRMRYSVVFQTFHVANSLRLITPYFAELPELLITCRSAVLTRTLHTHLQQKIRQIELK